MKIRWIVFVPLFLLSAALPQQQIGEQQVRSVVRSFYAAFNSHGWKHAESFATEDWNHINPLGGWTRGRTAVLKELEKVHGSFLKGVSDTIEDMIVTFASPDVAVSPLQVA
jgi:ketosteroid isomerase-like protein